MAENALLFLQLKGLGGGLIKGESRVEEYLDWIEIDDWDWKLEPKGEGDDAEVAIPSVFSFSKPMDRASTAMLLAMTLGDALTASLRMEDASRIQFRLSMAFERARFTRYELKTKVSDKRGDVEEQWEFDYESVLFKFRPDKASGSMQLKLDRPPGSSTDSPQSGLKALLKASEGMGFDELSAAVPSLLEAKKQQQKQTASRSASADKKKPG